MLSDKKVSLVVKDNVLRKPNWLRMQLGGGDQFAEVSKLVKEHGLNTICGSGKCPNVGECWSKRVATFMIGGDVCTRKCRFCATKSGKPTQLDVNEPIKVARSIKIMELKHAVVTSVDRDDLVDGGAKHWCDTIAAIRKEAPNTTIEILIPDFDAKVELMDMILEVKADVVGHNIETVRRLTPIARSRATYERSLEVLKYCSDHGAVTKSGIMVGLGESDDEVIETLRDLYNVGVRRTTIGQYLQPTKEQLSVERYVTPETFDMYAQRAKEIGFTHVFSAPLVRSSYMAEL